MKKLRNLFTATLIIISYLSFGQNVGINSTGSVPSDCSILDISSTDKGLLIPHVDLTDITIFAPITGAAVDGLEVYSNTSPVGGNGTGFYYWSTTPSAHWVKISDNLSLHKILLPIMPNNAGVAFADNQTTYCGPSSTDAATPEYWVQMAMPACTVTDIKVTIVGSNTVSSITTFTVQKNGVATTLVASVPGSTPAGAGVIGIFTGSGSIVFAEGDLISVKIFIPSVPGARQIIPVSVSIFYQPQ